MPSFTAPLAIGITDKHWIHAAKAYLLWHGQQKTIDQETLSESLKTLDSLVTGTPQPSWDKAKISFIRVLPAKANDLLSQIPQKPFIHISRALLIKDNNEFALKQYYKFRDTFRDFAIKYRDVAQKLDNGKITTVGYQFSQFYSNLRKILDDLVLSRRYVETITDSTDLGALNEGFSADQLSFMAKELELFDFPSFSSSNQNWFVENAKELANLSKGVIKYIEALLDKRQAKADNILMTEAKGSSDAIIAFDVPEFSISLDTYTGVFTQMHNAFAGVHKVIKTMEVFPDVIQSGVLEADRKIVQVNVLPAFKRIFDGERKREVFDEIFFEGSEVDNMIYRLSQELNNEYRDSTQPVCCVGFTEGAIIFLGKILPMLNFPLYLITDKLSFYGAETSGDVSKSIDIHFDNTKYDGKRVIVFDDIIDQGITVKKFLEQARAKTKALDFKLCMLFAKPNPHNVYGKVDFLGGMLPNVWVVGYGFDTLYKHRNADAVGSIKESFKKE